MSLYYEQTLNYRQNRNEILCTEYSVKVNGLGNPLNESNGREIAG